MISIIDLLEKHEVDFKRPGESSHVRQGWVGVDCLWCGEGSHKYHLGINVDDGYATCWQCGYHPLAQVLFRLTGVWISSKDAERFGRARSVAEHPEISPLRLPAGRSPLSPPHTHYLASRGLDAASVASRWGLEGIGIHASLSWRIFIPIHLNGRMVSWTTRAIGDHPVRYISARPEDGGMPIKHLLYGEDYCGHSVIVVEGPTDVWTIGPGAVATFGIAYSQEQVAKLARFPMRTVCFDSEPEAQRAADKLCRALQLFAGETHRVELDSSDPGEAKQDEINWLRSRFL